MQMIIDYSTLEPSRLEHDHVQSQLVKNFL